MVKLKKAPDYRSFLYFNRCFILQIRGLRIFIAQGVLAAGTSTYRSILKTGNLIKPLQPQHCR